jgi:ABC-type polysaccharide/polyol phosphate transport system ATPase subunit
LKILSHITEPTSGTAETCGGRVGTLLEVGDAQFQQKRRSW